MLCFSRLIWIHGQDNLSPSTNCSASFAKPFWVVVEMSECSSTLCSSCDKYNQPTLNYSFHKLQALRELLSNISLCPVIPLVAKDVIRACLRLFAVTVNSPLDKFTRSSSTLDWVVVYEHTQLVIVGGGLPPPPLPLPYSTNNNHPKTNAATRLTTIGYKTVTKSRPLHTRNVMLASYNQPLPSQVDIFILKTLQPPKIPEKTLFISIIPITTAATYTMYDQLN